MDPFQILIFVKHKIGCQNVVFLPTSSGSLAKVYSIHIKDIPRLYLAIKTPQCPFLESFQLIGSIELQ